MSFTNATTANPNGDPAIPSALGYTVSDALVPTTVSSTVQGELILTDQSNTTLTTGVWLINANVVFSSGNGSLDTAQMQIATPTPGVCSGTTAFYYGELGPFYLSNQIGAYYNHNIGINYVTINVTTVYYVSGTVSTNQFGIAYSFSSNTGNNITVAETTGIPGGELIPSTITYTKIA